MIKYITGTLIKELREKSNMTQAELAEKLSVSDKTVSKWETGKGFPDISLLQPIAKAFNISVAELISGIKINNVNTCANVLRSKFYVCPICGNVIHCMGEASVSCHGCTLTPLKPEETDENHMIFIEKVEDDYYIQIDHDMSKEHYISFIAALSENKVQYLKLYPEGGAEARFNIRDTKKVLFYCNKDGLFSVDIIKGVHDKEASYDNTNERKELEKVAKLLFG